jgi:hypothetical protein
MPLSVNCWSSGRRVPSHLSSRSQFLRALRLRARLPVSAQPLAVPYESPEDIQRLGAYKFSVGEENVPLQQASL